MHTISHVPVARQLFGILFLFLSAFVSCSDSGDSNATGERSAIPYLSMIVTTVDGMPADIQRAKFIQMRSKILDEGFSNSVHWFKLHVPPFEKGERYFIVFEGLTLDQAAIYLPGNLKAPLAISGDHFPRSSWSVPWSDFPAFPIEEGKTYFIRLQTTSLLMMPVTIRTEANLRDFTERRTFLSALYAGFILMLLLAAVLLFIALRDIVYLLYAGYIGMQTVAFASLLSSFYRLLWPESPYIQNHLYFFAQALSLTFGTAFFRVFMDLPDRRPKQNMFVMMVTAISFVVAIGTLFSSQNVIFSRTLSAIYLLWIPIFLFMTMRKIEPGRVDIWIFALVWGAVYVAGILYMLLAARIVEYSPILFYGPTVLLPFDAIFFVLSLYQRYRNIEAARFQLEREMQSTLAKLAASSRINHAAKEKKYPRTKLAGMDVTKKLEKLDHILRVEKAFKNESLGLSDLAEKIGVTPHQLSEICNVQLNTSFPKLLSYHRVLEAIELFSSGDLNILHVAFESGFASKSAFNIEFKRVTGMTPRAYRALPVHLRGWRAEEKSA